MSNIYENKDILTLNIENFVKVLINNKKFKTEDDVKLFVLEHLKREEEAGESEIPITYSEIKDNEVIRELVEYEGEALTDEYIDELKKNNK